MPLSAAMIARLEVGALFDALRIAAERAEMGLSITFLDEETPEVLLLNQRAVDIFGRSQEDLNQLGVWQVVAPEEVERLKVYRKRRLAKEQVADQIEIWIERRGVRVPLSCALSDVQIDGRAAVISLFADMSERKQTMRALNESEARFRMVVDCAPDGVVILKDVELRFLNARAAMLLALPSPEAGVGRSIAEFLQPEEVDRAVAGIRRTLQAREVSSVPAEYRTRGSGSQERVVELSSIPIDLAGERVVLAFARDVTERKAIQNRLAEAERLTALGVLSAGVAHEINNPLSYLMLNLEYLQRELPKIAKAPQRLDELLHRVRAANHGAERVANIVRDLRTFARGDEGVRGPVNLDDVVSTAITICGNAVRQKAALRRESGPTPIVDGNPNRLEQVFMNLLLNAAQALPGGHAEVDEIRVRVFGSGAQAVVEIQDTGPGMTPEVQACVFEPFFTTKPVGVGTGLGLPICRNIIALHGGSIEVESKVGVGTTFRILLPACPGVRAPQPRRISSRPPPPMFGGRGRVLIVDDEEVVGQSLGLVLQDEHDVHVVATAAQVLELLREGRTFDVILCDLMMPGMTGIDLCEAIRGEYPPLAQRIVFMTGGELLARAETFLANADHALLRKPFDMSLVRRTVRSLIQSCDANATARAVGPH